MTWVSFMVLYGLSWAVVAISHTVTASIQMLLLSENLFCGGVNIFFQFNETHFGEHLESIKTLNVKLNFCLNAPLKEIPLCLRANSRIGESL